MGEKSQKHEDKNINMDDRTPLGLKGSEHHHDLKDQSKSEPNDD